MWLLVLLRHCSVHIFERACPATARRLRQNRLLRKRGKRRTRDVAFASSARILCIIASCSSCEPWILSGHVAEIAAVNRTRICEGTVGALPIKFHRHIFPVHHALFPALEGSSTAPWRWTARWTLWQGAPRAAPGKARRLVKLGFLLSKGQLNVAKLEPTKRRDLHFAKSPAFHPVLPTTPSW